LRAAVASAARAFDAEESAAGGSSTLLLGQLAPTGMLHLLNLGDSAALIFRPAARRLNGHNAPVRWPRLVARTHEAQHYFNCPYQASADTLLKSVVEGADELCVVVRPGDVVVAATDGVMDNLFVGHMQEVIAGHLRALATEEPAECATVLTALANRLAKLARAVGLREGDQTTRTPFAEAARAEGIVGFEGGKLDDVAVVCGVVRERDGRSTSAATLDNFARGDSADPD